MKVLSECDASSVLGGMIGGGYIGPGIPLLETSTGSDGDMPTVEMEPVTVWGEAICNGGSEGGFSFADGAQLGAAFGAVWGASGWLTGAAGFTAFGSIGEAIAVGAMIGGAVGIGAVVIGGAIAYFIFR